MTPFTVNHNLVFINPLRQLVGRDELAKWINEYQFSFSDNIGIAAEWLSIKTYRSAWSYYAIPTTATERQSQLTLKLRF